MTDLTSKDELRDYILDLVDYREDRADSIMALIEATSQRAQLQILRGFRRRDFVDENMYKIAVLDRIKELQDASN